MAAGDEFRSFVAAAIDERFMQPAKARAWNRGNVLESQGLDHVHHEIGSRTVQRQHFNIRSRVAFLRYGWKLRLRRRRYRLCGKRSGARGKRSDTAYCRTFQES